MSTIPIVQPTETEAVELAPSLPVTVTLYVPSQRLEQDAEVQLLLHKYVYGGVPPLAFADTDPSQIPQVAFIEVGVACGALQDIVSFVVLDVTQVGAATHE